MYKKPILEPRVVKCDHLFFRLNSNTLFDNGCAKKFEIKYNRCSGDYVKKNDCSYWTGKETEEERHICNECLIILYKEKKYDFWKNVTRESKRRLLRSYVNNGSLNGTKLTKKQKKLKEQCNTCT